MTPRFSIVIPTFNAEAFLPATLASLAEQTFRDFEVIVVDDGSADRSVALAQECLRESGLPATVLRRPPSAPKGVSTSRNIGLAHARADWVGFLDSDDLYLPHALERLDAEVRATGGVVRALHHRTERFEDQTGRSLGFCAPPTAEPIQDLLPLLLEGNFLPPCATMFERRLLVELGGFDCRLHGIEDYWLVLRVSRRTPWSIVDDTLAQYRVRATSLMHNRPLAQYTRQNARLLRLAAASGELTHAELTILRRQLLGPQIRYFEGQAFARGGWRDVLAGLWVLAREGYPRASTVLLGRRLRHQVMLAGSQAHRALRARQEGRPGSAR